MPKSCVSHSYFHCCCIANTAQVYLRLGAVRFILLQVPKYPPMLQDQLCHPMFTAVTFHNKVILDCQCSGVLLKLCESPQI